MLTSGAAGLESWSGDVQAYMRRAARWFVASQVPPTVPRNPVADDPEAWEGNDPESLAITNLVLG
jgi:hypothetical protein